MADLSAVLDRHLTGPDLGWLRGIVSHFLLAEAKKDYRAVIVRADRAGAVATHRVLLRIFGERIFEDTGIALYPSQSAWRWPSGAELQVLTATGVVPEIFNYLVFAPEEPCAAATS